MLLTAEHLVKSVILNPKVLSKIVANDLEKELGISITKTCLYNFDPLKPHFYIVKLGVTWLYIIFLISAQKHRLWVLVRTASMFCAEM